MNILRNYPTAAQLLSSEPSIDYSTEAIPERDPHYCLPSDGLAATTCPDEMAELLATVHLLRTAAKGELLQPEGSAA